MFNFLVGASIAAGFVLVALSVIYKPVLLQSRVLPHIGTRTSVSTKKKLALGIGHLASTVLDKIGSTAPSVQRRLDVAGEGSLREFRLGQFQSAGVALSAGVVIGIALVARGVALPIVVVTAAIGALVGAVVADSRLSTKAQKASQSMTRELPDIVELLGLAVASGEPIRVSIEDLVTRGDGVMIKQFSRMVKDMHAGVSLPAALADLATRTGNRHVGRFCETVTTALEQGSGLATALHSQARDARDAARRSMIEQGGKAEVSMMIPVVFLILPITVLFTLFPAISTLQFL